MLDARINTFLELCKTSGAARFDRGKYVLPEDQEEYVIKSGIPYEISGIQIQLKLKVFFNDCNVQYLDYLLEGLEDYELANQVILVSSNGCYWFDPQNNEFHEKGSIDEEAKRVFRNAIGYFTFFEFLTKKGICDYYNYANNEIVFYNSATGIIKIHFDHRPLIDFPNEITSGLNQLQQFAETPGITSIFINAIYQLSGGTGSIDLKTLILFRQKLLDITKRDYELISKKFDFARFRDSLYAEKEKYFASIRELISKIFGQAIGIPISIGASVFTTYKAEGGNLVISLILVSFILYLFYYLRIQWIYKADINEVEEQFTSDFSIIAANSGLPPLSIEQEKGKIQRRISQIHTMQNWMIGFVLILGILAIGFMVSQYFPKKAKTPDPTVKEFAEAIKKFNTMADSLHNDLKSGNTIKGLSPLNFTIKVYHKGIMYEADIVRVSEVGKPNEYYSTIPNSDTAFKKFPTVVYVVYDSDLVYKDSLSSMLPGFAEEQKRVLIAELIKHKWRF